MLLAYADAGADAIEIGIPFSDPVMDGPTIQEASQRALEAGATPQCILEELREVESLVPLVAMTYANLAHKAGWPRFATDLARAAITGAILPDLPLEESPAWEAAARDAGVATVLLAAPNSPDDRLARICQRSRGFVYGVTVMGVTGARSDLGATASVLGDRLKAATDLPVPHGLRGERPEQAAALPARRRRRHSPAGAQAGPTGRRRPALTPTASSSPAPSCASTRPPGRRQARRRGPTGRRRPRRPRRPLLLTWPGGGARGDPAAAVRDVRGQVRRRPAARARPARPRRPASPRTGVLVRLTEPGERTEPASGPRFWDAVFPTVAARSAIRACSTPAASSSRCRTSRPTSTGTPSRTRGGPTGTRAAGRCRTGTSTPPWRRCSSTPDGRR